MDKMMSTRSQFYIVNVPTADDLPEGHRKSFPHPSDSYNMDNFMWYFQGGRNDLMSCTIVFDPQHRFRRGRFPEDVEKSLVRMFTRCMRDFNRPNNLKMMERIYQDAYHRTVHRSPPFPLQQLYAVHFVYTLKDFEDEDEDRRVFEEDATFFLYDKVYVSTEWIDESWL